MLRTIGRLAPGLAALLLARALAAQEPPAPPVAPSPPPAGIRTLGDLRAVNVADELEALLAANEGLVGSLERRPVAFAAALAKARELARAAVPPDSLAAALHALPDLRTDTLRLFAFGQLAAGKPSAAFAVIVAAQEREPASPDLLADLAGLLAGFGRANEALAILDELARRNALPAPPWGISGRDALDYIRGYALARTGERAAALDLVRAVADREPQLAEAARLAAILSEDEAEQRKYFLLGTWRHRSPLMVCAGVNLDRPEPDAVTAGAEVAIDPRSILDLSRGKPGRLPALRYARSVLQANDLVPRMQAAIAAAQQTESALAASRQRPRGYEHTESSLERVWGYEMSEWVTSIHFRDARLRELDRRRRAINRERGDAWRKVEADRKAEAGAARDAYVRACMARKYDPTPEQIAEVQRPMYDTALARLLPYLVREEEAERAWFAEWHLLTTAMAAQVGDAGWHEYIRLTIEAERWRAHRRQLNLVRAHAEIGRHRNIAKEAGEVPTDPPAEEIGKCDGNTSIGFATGHLPGGQALPFEFGVEMTCEGISLEVAVDTRVPGLSVSAEVGGDTHGNFTAFVGPKVEAGMGEKGIAEFTASVKGGAYVTGNRDGVTDAGVKYELKTNAKLGSYSSSQKLAEGSVSFIPAPAGGADLGPLAP